jgi:magnesium transporter
MIERYSQGKLLWINLKEPTSDEIHEVIEECNIPPALMSDFSSPVPRSGITVQDSAVKITMDFPIVKRTDINFPHEIKFIVTKKYLITAHYEDMEALDRFKKEFEVVSTLHKGSKSATAAHLFVALLERIYEVTMNKLDYATSKLNDIEAEIFNQRERQMVLEISQISKRLIAFRQVIKTHDSILRDATPVFAKLFGASFSERMQNIHTTYFDIVRRTTAIFETLGELRNTNSELLTTKQNEVMKTLTIMAFITFPLTLMTSVFSMNTTTTPIIGNTGDFWIILGLMSIATICFFVFFKYKKWM